MPIASVLHILRTIKDRGVVSRTNLQQLTGLSWGTVTNTTRELLNRKLIREDGAVSTKAGRKPMQLALNPHGHSLVGVDMGMDALQCIVMNLAGESLWHEKVAVNVADGPEVMVVRAADLVKRAMSSSSLISRSSMGIGVSVPGFLDSDREVVRAAPHSQKWVDTPVREMLEKRLAALGLGGEFVRLELRANCLATAERWFGEASQVEDLLCIELDASVGLGVVIKGDIFRGSEGAAGNFAHMTVDPNGPSCVCGRRGCVEVYCAAGALLEYAQSRAAAKHAAVHADSIAELTRRASAGNVIAVETWERMGCCLGLGIGNLMALFDPGMVVLAGRTTAGAAHFMPAVARETERPCWPPKSRKVVVSQLGESAAAMGACGVILQAAFEPEGMEGEKMAG